MNKKFLSFTIVVVLIAASIIWIEFHSNSTPQTNADSTPTAQSNQQKPSGMLSSSDSKANHLPSSSEATAIDQISDHNTDSNTKNPSPVSSLTPARPVQTRQNQLAMKNAPLDKKANLPQESINDILNDPRIDWKNPEQRAAAAKRMKAAEDRDLAQAKVIAQQMGIPIREELPDGRVRVVAGLNNQGQLIYHEDKNLNAAISTGADKIQSTPFTIDGSGVKVGVWEAGGLPRATHQEFNDGASSRVNLIDSGSNSFHATHVTGTIAAFGVDPNAKGAAYQTIVDAYTSANNTSEITLAAATASGQHTSKIYVSNHSYGPVYGWFFQSGRWQWLGTGTDQNAYDSGYGQYSFVSQFFDNIHYNSPYHLAFWSAGNENTDGPNNGATVVIPGIDPANNNEVVYNSAIHPPKDGLYSGDFDTLGDQTVAKNIMVIGAANDAVTAGVRDPSKSTITSFSSTGPCDDGRIKPDVVGNGANLYSTSSSSDVSYGNSSGTSMSAPNVCGTAALLVDLYRSLNAGNAMRSSTLRGLLIHTATDIGNPGPDYTYGWGLVDGEKAAKHIQREADLPLLEGIVEDQVTPSQSTKTVSFLWDGTSPIRATLAWTDPPAPSQNTHNDRTPDLVNDLNLKLIAPDGTEYFPFVMPFVGTWTVASMSQNATTGVNHVDNVEQVLLQSPGQTGTWTAEVSYIGNLTDNLQEYGLIISGSTLAGPQITTSPNMLNATTGVGTNADTQSFTIQNTGTGTANYTITDDATWISCTPTSGSSSGETDTINVTFLTAGLNTGTYTATITITTPNSIQPTTTIPVTLEIFAPTIFSENFDSISGGGLPDQWTQQLITNNTTWKSQIGGRTGGQRPSTAQGGSGQNMTLFRQSTVAAISRLITPLINIKDYQDLNLNFWHTQELWSPDQDELKVYYSTDSGSNWVEMVHYTSNVNLWTERNLALPSGTDTIQIAFEGIAKYGYGVCIDTVSITGTPNQTTYSTWAQSSFTNPFTLTDISNDPDGDGILNFMEFSFGMDPTVANQTSIAYISNGNLTSPGMPTIENPGGGFNAVFARRKDFASSGLTYTVEFSADLSSWTSSNTGLQVVTGAGNPGDYEAVSVPFPSNVPLQAGGTAAPSYFRVQVSME